MQLNICDVSSAPEAAASAGALSARASSAMGTPLERKPSMDSIKTSSTVDHELQIGHVSGRHADSLVRNLEGDDFDLAEDQRLLRDISCATTGLKDRFLKREGHNLLLEGNYLRNNMTKNSAGAKWPLCVPRVEVSLPGCTLSSAHKLRIYNDLAKEFAEGKLKGSIKSNFVIRQREEVYSESMKRRASAHEKNLHRVTALLPGAGKPGTREEKESKKLWNLVGNRRLSAHSVLAPVKLLGKEPTDDGLCHLSLNPNPLRHLSSMYPRLGFRKPGATSRAAFTRYYESEVLRPMRYTMRYEMGQSQLRKSMSAAATTLGSTASLDRGGHSQSLGHLQMNSLGMGTVGTPPVN
ncbi:hypothetical protein JL722_10048 [Aureococcus anophagefferens]|nr:hypothetical protein JL722_10048 [Aureococcus anophagefferens]